MVGRLGIVCALAGLAVGMTSTGAWAFSSPPVTSGLIVALDGSDVTTTGTAVDSWNDQAAGGGTNSASQSGTRRPTLVTAGLNGHNTIRFDGSNDFLEIGADSDFDTDTFTWFMVFRTDILPVSGVQILLTNSYTDIGGAASFSSERNAWLSFVTSSEAGLFASLAREPGGFSSSATHPSVASEFFVLSAVLRSNDSITQYLDGVTGTTGTGASMTPTGHLRSMLGAQEHTSPGNYIRFLDGELAEVLIYNQDLGNSDRESVESYLGSKYGITVIPEPRTATLIGLGLAFIAWRSRTSNASS